MKICRVFVTEYPGRIVGDIFDLIDPNSHPGSLLSGTIKEVPVEDDFDHEVNTATVAEDQSVSFAIDPTKVTAKLNRARHAKLQALRNLRAPKLSEVDILVNDLALEDTSLTLETVKDYRQALKNVTDPFKNYDFDSGHATALDALVVETFEWPPMPE